MKVGIIGAGTMGQGIATVCVKRRKQSVIVNIVITVLHECIPLKWHAISI